MLVKHKIEGPNAIITIDRPQALNAINREVILEFLTVLDDVESNEDIRTIIITGGGEKAFVAGGDIAAMKEMDLREGEEFVYLGHKFLNRIEKSKKVTIAAINGYALGGGTELALACDMRVALKKAKLGLPEVTIGLFPGWGGTQRLGRLVGVGIAKELIFTGKQITAMEAYRIGLVNRVVDENLLETCKEIGENIAKNAPIAIVQAKKALNEGLQVPLEHGLVIEAEAWLTNFASKDRVEGLSSFLEKRSPKYKNE